MDATLNIFICTVLVVKIPSKAISPLAFPASRGFQWNRCAVCLQNGRLDADRCHGDPSRRSTLRTLVVFAAESWKLASSFCTHPAQKKKSWVLESGSETQYLVLAQKKLQFSLYRFTSASFFKARVFSTFSSNCWASSTFPSPPSCSALASSLPISSFNSWTRSACFNGTQIQQNVWKSLQWR